MRQRLRILTVTVLLISYGCHKTSRTQPQREPSHITIVDVSPRPNGDKRMLRVELTDDSDHLLAELYDLAVQHFPEKTWMNFGPDSSYREIVFFSRGRKVELRSWHPLYETNPNVVAASYGLTSLEGRTREEFLRHDDQTYVAQRRAFDEIDQRLRKRFGG